MSNHAVEVMDPVDEGILQIHILNNQVDDGVCRLNSHECNVMEDSRDRVCLDVGGKAPENMGADVKFCEMKM